MKGNTGVNLEKLYNLHPNTAELITTEKRSVSRDFLILKENNANNLNIHRN